MHGAWCASYSRRTPYYNCTYGAGFRAHSRTEHTSRDTHKLQHSSKEGGLRAVARVSWCCRGMCMSMSRDCMAAGVACGPHA